MLFNPRPKGVGFLKLADGEEVSGAFVGAPYTFRQHWVKGRGAECQGEGCTFCANPELDKDGKAKFPGFRFRINFVTTIDGKYAARIFEGGGKTYDKLVALDKKFDLTNTSVEITRRGVKQNTDYDFYPGKPITEKVRAQIKAVELLPLGAGQAAPEMAEEAETDVSEEG